MKLCEKHRILLFEISKAWLDYSFDGIVLIKIVRIAGMPTKIIENVKL